MTVPRVPRTLGDVPLWMSIALCLPFMVWMFPQTVAGAVIAIYRRAQGHRVCLYRFGPFLCAVVAARGPASAGISLGLFAFAEHEGIIRHELCHVVTGLWLGWFYLPVYGLEYLILGYEGSWHERLTCRFERTLSWTVEVVATSPKPPSL